MFQFADLMIWKNCGVQRSNFIRLSFLSDRTWTA